MKATSVLFRGFRRAVSFTADVLRQTLTLVLSFMLFAGPHALRAHNGIEHTTTPSSATVRTDKDDYPPGATAYISGEGFFSGESVRLQVLHKHVEGAADTDDSGAEHDPWVVLADGAGAISSTWHVCEDDCLGATLQLTAEGLASGRLATWTFTDGNTKVFAAQAGVTFSGVLTQYSEFDLQGTATASSFSGISSSNALSKGIPNGNSVKLEAAAFSDQGGKFLRWESTDLFTGIDTADTTKARIIKINVDGTSTHEHRAHYEVVSKQDQTITFAAIPNQTYGDPSFTISASASSGLKVDFSVLSGSSKVSVSSSTLSAGVSSATVTILGASPTTDVIIVASQGGSTNYNVAPNVQRAFRIAKATATVALGNLTQTYSGSALTPSATTVPSNLAVTWTNAPQTAAGTYKVTATINDANYEGSASGSFTITKATASVALGNLSQTYTGSALSPTVTTTPASLNVTWTNAPQTNAGSYEVTATVNDSNYVGSASGTFTINKATAAVALADLTQTYTGSALTPTASTTPSGLAVTLTGAPQTNAGSYPVTATINDANYTGSANGTFKINKAAATVALDNLTAIYTGSALTPTATTTPAGLSVTFVGAPQTSAGSYPVTATIVDANYEGSTNDTFKINKAGATVTLGNLTQTYTGSALNPSVVTNPAGLSVALEGGAQVNAGSYPVSATVTDANYTGSDSATFTIEKAGSSVTATGGTFTYDGQAHAASATTNPEGLTVTFKYNGSSDAPVNAGTYNVIATTAGNANYNGSSGNATITINKASATVTFTASTLAQVYDGSVKTVSATTSIPGLKLNYSFSSSPVGAGSYTVTATIDDPNYEGSATETLVISKANASVTLGNLAQTYTGAALTPGAQTNPANLPITWSGLPAVGANSYAVTATINDANYQGSASGTLVISPRAITVTAAAKTKTYGDGDPVLTYQSSEALVNGNSFTGGLARTAGENIGGYAINQNTLTAGANYAITYVPANLTITARPLTITADSKSKFFGEADPALTYQVNGALQFSDALTGALTRTAGTAPGSYPITQGTLTAGGNYSITYVGGTLTINARPVTVTYLGATAGTFGECMTVSGKLVDVISGLPIQGATLTLAIGGNSATATTDANGVASAPLSLAVAPAADLPTAVTASATFAGGVVNAAVYAAGNDAKSFTMNPALASPYGATIYTGETVFWTTSSTSSTASLALSATVADKASNCAPDITKARVTFSVSKDGLNFTPLTGATNLPVGQISADSKRVGTASATVQYNIGNSNTIPLFLRVEVSGAYAEAVTEASAISISKPVGGQITGTGTLDNSTVVGTLPGLTANSAGSTSTSLGVTYNKSGTNPQGGINVVVRTGTGKVYVLKSTAISTFAVNMAKKTSSFSAKCSILDVTNPDAVVSIDGGALMQVSVTDGGAGPADAVSISVQNQKTGGLWFGSNWSATSAKVVEKALTCGNLTVN